jgi:hypothetical protein
VFPTDERRVVDIIESMIWSELPRFRLHADEAEPGCCSDRLAEEELMMAAVMDLGSCLGI